DAERSGRLAADGGGERHRAVDKQLPRLQRRAQVVEVLRLGAEGHGEKDDRRFAHGVLVLATLGLRFWHRLAQAIRRLGGAPSVARSDHNRHASSRPAQRQPEAEGAGPAHDRYRGRRIARIGHRRPSLDATYAPPRMRLEARKALVTGGAGGIGTAIARRLAAEGAEVWVGDLDSDAAG